MKFPGALVLVLLLLFVQHPVLAVDKDPSEAFFGEKINDSIYDNAFTAADSSGVKVESEQKWSEKDILDIFPELQILDEISQKNSLERLNKARAYYHDSLKIISDFQNQKEKASYEVEIQEFQWDWQKKEYKDRLIQDLARQERKARLDASDNLILAMQELDRVRNPVQLSSPGMQELQADIYRQFVKLQFANRNIKPCISVLEKYIALSNERAAEPEPHRLLAAGFRHQEIMALKMRNKKASLLYKRRKNAHLLKYAELAFGAGSPQHAALSRQAERDMIEVLP